MANGIPWHGQERRRTLRFPCALSVRCRPLEGEEAEADGESQDVSVGGLSVLSPIQYQVGSQVELTFESPVDEAELHLVGIVRRSIAREEGGYDLGIEFNETDWATRANLLSMAPRQPWGADGWQNRSYVRLDCKLPMRYKAGIFSGWRETRTRDLSIGGMMFEAARNLRPGSRVKMQINCVKGIARVNGVVVEAGKVSDSGFIISVAFIDPSDEAQGTIADYITRTSAKEN